MVSKTTIYCDICRNIIKNKNIFRIKINGPIFQYHINYSDVCKNCTEKISEKVNELIEEIRKPS